MQINKLRQHHLYMVNGKVMVYLDAIQYQEYKFVCVGARNYDDYKEIKKAFRTNKFQRTEKQSQIIKNCHIKRITILKKDFKKNKIKFVLGQPIQKKMTDYCSWN